MSDIRVVYTCACTRCGSTNIQREVDMDKDHFEKMRKEDPSAYWKEHKPQGVIYRQHEESAEGNCPRSC